MSGPAPLVRLSGSASVDGVPLFAPLTLELVAGGWTCLLGGSGVGKSTILRLIAGLPTGASFQGKIDAADGAGVADRVAYMAQDDLLLPWVDLGRNLGLGARLRGQRPDPDRIRQMLDHVGLGAHARKRPSALSGGQRQRAALARTLLEDKPIVLLDEPFSALDAGTRADMQDLAVELLQGRTVLLVTHDPAEAARLGHSIAVLEHEGLTAVPPPKAPVPRPVEDPQVLARQAELLNLLRGGRP